MKTIRCISASEGYAIGKIIIKNHNIEVEKYKIQSVESELERFYQAKEITVKKIHESYQRALSQAGEAEAEIFAVHEMMIRDEDLNERIVDIIKNEHFNAEFAVKSTRDSFSEMFLSLDDEYMKARSSDVIDICNTIIGCFSIAEEEDTVSENYIYASDDLLPSQAINLDKSKVQAFVTKLGSVTSHAAIISRTLGIPSLVSVGDDFEQIKSGSIVAVDGFEGKLIIGPDEITLQDYKHKIQQYHDYKRQLLVLKDVAAITKDGTKISIYSNTGSLEETDFAVDASADGIGLFRSEFLYMNSNNFPSEETQYEIYKQVLLKMQSKPVIIRTLDIGADKHVDYLKLEREENPAMGYRAIRICLDREEIFKTQLKALLRASVHGNLYIMLPMITNLDEVLKTKDIIDKLKSEMNLNNTAYSDNIQLGVMIETPAAVMISDILAKHVDFFSIGTNDLTQYCIAVDRMNSKISNLYDPSHIAVLRMIKMVADNANKNNIWTGICGESAADEKLLPFYLSIGIKELSVTPSNVLKLKKAIIESDVTNKNDIIGKFIG